MGLPASFSVATGEPVGEPVKTGRSAPLVLSPFLAPQKKGVARKGRERQAVPTEEDVGLGSHEMRGRVREVPPEWPEGTV